MTTDETEILALIAGLCAANHGKDADGVMAAYAPRTMVFGLAPPLWTVAADPAEGRKELIAWFDTWRGPIGYDTRDLVVEKSGHLALVYGLLRIHGTKVDGTEDGVWVRLTFGLRKLAGAWLIVHEHLSTPFHMDGSYRAAVDLQP